ncbi:MAG: hypothetical protein R8K21_04310 [Mariprofundales bacterium]
MSSAVSAWLLDIGGDISVALGKYLMREIISTHEKHLYPIRRVAMSNDYCHDIMLWRGLLLPIMQLDKRITENDGHKNNNNDKEPSLLVVAIPPVNDEGMNVLAYGVLQIWSMPEAIEVWDSHACDYPNTNWQNLASSCFHYNNQAIPILDTNKVFLG